MRIPRSEWLSLGLFKPGQQVTAAEIKGRVENSNLHAVSGARILCEPARHRVFNDLRPGRPVRYRGVQGAYQVLVLRLGYRSHQEEMSLASENSARKCW